MCARMAAGACGLNLGDSNHRTDKLVDPAVQAERIAGTRAAGQKLGVPFVINARINSHLRQLSSTLPASAMSASSCLYPPFIQLSGMAREGPLPGRRTRSFIGFNVVVSGHGAGCPDMAASGPQPDSQLQVS